MTKFRWYYDTDRETEWLNEMAEKGYAMEGFFLGFYFFEECTPGKYLYQIDFSEEFGHVHSAYREFLAETGVEIIKIWGFWVYLRKRAEEGPFELYSDVESRVDHYKKICRIFQVALFVELICAITQLFCGLGIISSVLWGQDGLLSSWSFGSPEGLSFPWGFNGWEELSLSWRFGGLGRYSFFWGLAALPLAIGIAMEREIERMGKMIRELKSRQGEPEGGGRLGNRLPSRILLAGLFVLAAAMLFPNPIWKCAATGVCMLLILIGLALSMRRRKV
ncbi:MAG: DUF2812 domain-containing protein [Roseburia sp.]|nr:DUF2812 domain-containing protein [Roseburia sp.]MCM1098744.1 DUF2812 domain-containing protein [Ruminococcus flavefaciens]